MRIWRKTPLHLLCAMFLLLSVPACSAGRFVWVQNLPREASTPTGVIAAGDTVEIKVFGEEPLTTRARVRSDGIITLPLLGQVPVIGEKPAVLAATLTNRLKPYVKDPNVTVVILESEVTVTVVGEVKEVGVLTLQAPATVLQAIARTGGPTEFADRSKIFVLRDSGGRSQRIRFKYSDLLAGEPSAAGFRLRSGDVVVVE